MTLEHEPGVGSPSLLSWESDGCAEEHGTNTPGAVGLASAEQGRSGFLSAWPADAKDVSADSWSSRASHSGQEHTCSPGSRQAPGRCGVLAVCHAPRTVLGRERECRAEVALGPGFKPCLAA